MLSIQIEYAVQIGYDQTAWQTVEVTDRADIQALLADGIDDAMVYYQGDNQYANSENHTIVISATLQDSTVVYLDYLAEDWPYEIVDKYRPGGVNDSTPEDGMAVDTEAVA